MKQTWRELIERAKNDDQNAFSELYQNSYDAVYRTVKSMVRDDEAVLDIVQDSYIKGFQSLSSLGEPYDFVAWMKQIATNKAKDWFKKRHDTTFSQLSDDEEDEPDIDFEDDVLDHSPEAVIDRNETARLIEEILGTLSDEQRIAVGMFYYQDMSVLEIAEKLGISENTVKSRLNYGRKKIKTGVEELEKRGTKLYGLAPIPFLIWLFRNQIAQLIVGNAPAAVFGGIMSGTASVASASVSSVGTGTASGTAAASGTSQVGAAVAAGKTGGILSSIGVKVAAVVISAAVVGGGVGAAMYFANQNDSGDSTIIAATTPGTTSSNQTEPTPEIHIHSWTDATCTTSKTCSECGETEGEPLGHTLADATYFTPAVCTVCGEAVGNPKPSYFEELGISVADAPSNYTHKGAVADENDLSYIIDKDFAATIVEFTKEPDTREGYNKVTFSVAILAELEWIDGQGHAGYNTAGVDLDIFDYYTGQRFFGEDSRGSNDNEYIMPIELDGTKYEITYSNDVTWDWEDWVELGDGNATCRVTMTHTYIFHVPENYDGLVYCALAGTDLTVDEGVQTQAFYAGQLNNLPECTFFRLNK